MELHADSIVKSFGGRAILTDICLSCRTGEIVGLFGRNGCGKSTLLKIIFGSLKADYRFVRVGARQIRSVAGCAGLIKYMPQDNFLPGNMRLRRIITLFCTREGAALLGEHDFVAPLLGARPHELSGGERRFFEVLLFIFSDARFVLLDEPFNGLSPLMAGEVKRLIRQESARKGFIVTDHSYRNILDVATRLALIHDGALRQIDDPSELRYWGYVNHIVSENDP